MYKYNPIEDCYATKKKIHIFRDEINKLRSNKKKIEIFDFGCGNALDCARYLINKVDEYYGYDIHNESIKFANKSFGSKNIIFSNKLPKKKFDVIIISEVLEHLDQPDKVINLLKTNLKNNGFILGSIPNGYGLTEIEKFIIHKFFIYKIVRYIYKFFRKKTSLNKNIPFNNESGHIQFFTLKKFKGVVFKNNLLIKFIKNGTLFGADLTGSTILKPDVMKKINTYLADFIPSFMSATWIFKLQKK